MKERDTYDFHFSSDIELINVLNSITSENGSLNEAQRYKNEQGIQDNPIQPKLQ